MKVSFLFFEGHDAENVEYVDDGAVAAGAGTVGHHGSSFAANGGWDVLMIRSS